MHRQLGLWDPVAAQVEGEKVGRRDPERALEVVGPPPSRRRPILRRLAFEFPCPTPHGPHF